MITISDYCKDNKITCQDFSNATGICYSRIAMIKNKVNPSVDLQTIIKIYNGTKEKFKYPLTSNMWLDISHFWEE